MIGNNAALAAALARFEGLYPETIELSLGRVEAALEALGRPQDRLPPVIHVAGTNGKGSTSAFMRAMAISYASTSAFGWPERSWTMRA